MNTTKPVRSLRHRLLRRRRGQGVVEYGLILGIMVVLLVVALTGLAGEIDRVCIAAMNAIASTLSSVSS